MSDEPNQDINAIPPLRFPWVAVIFFAALLVGAYLLLFKSNTPSPPPATAVSAAPLKASSGRITFAKDDGGNLTSVDRKGNTDVWFRVSLDNPPLGNKLALECVWIDPNGTVVHRNRYDTKEIDKAPWPTHAHYTLKPDAPIGRWTVRMSQDGRELYSGNFEVKDGESVAPVKPEKDF